MCGTPPDAGSAGSSSASTADSADPAAAAGRSAAEGAVEEFIQSRINFERLPTGRYGIEDFRLERVRDLLSRLGEPQRRPCVHIAGTKGKGSTAAMIAAIVRAAGYRVGLFTSPHMLHVGERMTVDGALPTSGELADLLAELAPAIEAMDGEGPSQRVTFFEALTAMAWLHFRRRNVDLVVLETGLGGRLDATNVCEPLVCLITSISRDHERLLGSTLAGIAGEKAGIFKRGVPAVSGVCDDISGDVIRGFAARVEAPLYELGESIHFQTVAGTGSQLPELAEPALATLDVQTPWRSHTALRSPLAGMHQAANLSLAVAVADCLNDTGWSIGPDAIVDGLRSVHWPLRVEVIGRHPLVVVDAAHNVASIAALVAALRPVRADERVLVFGAARDKDTAGMLQQLSGAFDRVILTRFVNNPRAVGRDRLEALAREQLDIPWTWSADPLSAWRNASQTTPARGMICAAGSFFLASEFRSAVLCDAASH